MKIKKPRIVIAGTSSGTGKTTIVTGLLAALKERGKNVQPFKIGPDYIDPGFHKLASGTVSHNLDTWLTPADMLPEIFAGQSQNADISIIEGVMGLYDGGKNGISSTADIAKRLNAPIILVLNCKAAGESVAATVLGFIKYDENIDIAGVILNNLGSKSHGNIIKEAVEKLGVKVIGEILRDEAVSLPERHLGLTPAIEQELKERISKIKDLIGKAVDLDAVLQIAENAKAIEIKNRKETGKLYDVKIGVASDKAFSFYYETSLSVLKNMGAELVFFSPLSDSHLPDVDGLFFGGGFPEMFAKELSENKSMIADIKKAADNCMPIYAECGGYMYLSENIVDFDGNIYPMAGVIPGTTKMQNKLQTVGYVKVKALKDNVLLLKGDTLQGHEFHFSVFEPTDEASSPCALEFEKMRTGAVHFGGYANINILASYLHMNFLSSPKAAQRFLFKCCEYRSNEHEK